MMGCLISWAGFVRKDLRRVKGDGGCLRHAQQRVSSLSKELRDERKNGLDDGDYKTSSDSEAAESWHTMLTFSIVGVCPSTLGVIL